jgi:Protein of unknown function (DUF732)
MRLMWLMVVLAATVMLAVPAAADTSSYSDQAAVSRLLADLAGVQIYSLLGDQQGMVADARNVCVLLGTESGELVARTVAEQTGLSAPDALKFTAIATSDLCPAQWRPQAVS